MGGRWTDRWVGGWVGGWAEALHGIKNPSATVSENPMKETSQKSCDRVTFQLNHVIQECVLLCSLPR